MSRTPLIHSATPDAGRPAARRSTFGAMARAILLAAALVACSDDGSAPDGPPPPAAVHSVVVTSPVQAVVVGATIEMDAVVRDRGGNRLDDRPVFWSSSDAQVAEVDQTGRVTARRPGAASIEAASGGVRGSVQLQVARIPVESFTVQPIGPIQWNEVKPLVFTVRDSNGQPLLDRTIVWTSADPAVAEVSAAGVVTAKGEGTTVVTGTVEGHGAQVTVQVNPAPVARVLLDIATLSLDAGEARQVAIRLEDPLGRPLAGRAVAWSSTSADVASVVDGHIVARRGGDATVTATAEGVSASVVVSVLAMPVFDLIHDRQSAAGFEIFVLGFPGRTSLRMNAGNVSREPSPSPDGSRFVFTVSQAELGGRVDDLFVVDRNGMNMRRLTTAEGEEIHPAWSPDGTRIAYVGTTIPGGSKDIYVVNVDGTGAVNLTAGMGVNSHELNPAWSPDGTRIAFDAAGTGGPSRIWTMRADGTDRRVLATDIGHDRHPTWSPDGTRIAFERHVSRPADVEVDIAIAPVAGGAATVLALPDDQWTPAWSPAGDYIAYTSWTTGPESRAHVFTMRPDGTGIRMRTGGAGGLGGRNPSWIRR